MMEIVTPMVFNKTVSTDQNIVCSAVVAELLAMEGARGDCVCVGGGALRTMHSCIYKIIQQHNMNLKNNAKHIIMS